MILELNNLITMIALSDRKKKRKRENEMIDRPVGVLFMERGVILSCGLCHAWRLRKP